MVSGGRSVPAAFATRALSAGSRLRRLLTIGPTLQTRILPINVLTAMFFPSKWGGFTACSLPLPVPRAISATHGVIPDTFGVAAAAVVGLSGTERAVLLGVGPLCRTTCSLKVAAPFRLTISRAACKSSRKQVTTRCGRSATMGRKGPAARLPCCIGVVVTKVATSSIVR